MSQTKMVVEREVRPTIQCAWDKIDLPGTYYSNWSGHLIRIPEEALKRGFSPLIQILGKEPMIVTKLSEDPYLPLSKARMIAADLDLGVNF